MYIFLFSETFHRVHVSKNIKLIKDFDTYNATKISQQKNHKKEKKD